MRLQAARCKLQAPSPKRPPRVWWGWVAGWWLVACGWQPSWVLAKELPSLFRGVVVADAELGVRVVRVEEMSQAYQADLRPEDLIIRIGDVDVHSIDEFSELSTRLKGQTLAAKVVVFRNGEPRELSVHLYSYPLLRTWGVEVVPAFDIRFAKPEIGLAYWTPLGRGFEEAGKLPEALDAYANGLDNVPADLPAAVKTAELFLRVGQAQLRSGRLAEGLGSLRQGMAMLERLFDAPLSDDQLRGLKGRLQEAVTALREAVRARPAGAAAAK